MQPQGCTHHFQEDSAGFSLVSCLLCWLVCRRIGRETVSCEIAAAVFTSAVFPAAVFPATCWEMQMRSISRPPDITTHSHTRETKSLLRGFCRGLRGEATEIAATGADAPLSAGFRRFVSCGVLVALVCELGWPCVSLLCSVCVATAKINPDAHAGISRGQPLFCDLCADEGTARTQVRTSKQREAKS